MAPHRGGTTEANEPDICEFVGNAEYPMVDDASHQRVSKPYKMDIVWRNVILFVFLHIGAVYGLYLFVFKAMWTSMLFSSVLAFFAGVGITAGAHRLWAHKSYKANTALKIILIIFDSISFQNDVIEWARDHRVHHKYSETDADPHNASRGFFFAHMGWLLVRKHPDVKVKGAKFDMSDLLSDPLLVFQRRFYKTFVLMFCFILPSVIPMLWGEKLYTAFYLSLLRYCYTLHVTWCINSVAHMWGFRPYDKNINPRQNLATAITAFGEGWHNYHHVFPYDYRASEFPYLFNPTTAFIDFFVKLGWAWDVKTVSQDMIQRKKLKTGE